MVGVTADTNIYISGYVFGGLPRRFLDIVAGGGFRLDISGAILNGAVASSRFSGTADSDKIAVLFQGRLEGVCRGRGQLRSEATI